jgi:hypothetical protein
LFSLIIMGSALVASSGMAVLVTGEISSVSLVSPAERAYYKAESYVEQGLWQKKQDPQYHVEDKSELPTNFLCNGNCFLTSPRNQAGALISYRATTSIPEEQLALQRDKVVQLDIDTENIAGATGTFDLGSIKNENGLLGVEVTVVAYPKDAPYTDVASGAGTPVFVEKRVFRYGDTPLSINLGPPEINKVGEPFPPLSTSRYRVRLKALGANTVVEPTATANPNTPLWLLTTDFRVSAVAEDGPARRGIEVLVPATTQIASIFDYVIFSDLALSKTDAKAAGKKSIKVTAYDDKNRNCVKDGADTPLPDIPVAADPGYTTSTDENGIASFAEVQPGSYTVRATLATGTTACNNNVPVSFPDNDSTEVRDITLLLRAPQRVPLYRFWSGFYGDHFYTTANCVVSGAVPACGPNGTWVGGVSYFGGGWFYEFIQAYVYNVQVPGTQPLYRLWNGGVGDHFYTMSLAEYNAVTWYTKEGVEAYLAPYTGSCPAGTVPLYRTYNNPGTDHFYTTNEAERNGVIAAGWSNEGVTGCAWTTPG